jgi:hypothetical protein
VPPHMVERLAACGWTPPESRSADVSQQTIA